MTFVTWEKKKVKEQKQLKVKDDSNIMLKGQSQRADGQANERTQHGSEDAQRRHYGAAQEEAETDGAPGESEGRGSKQVRGGKIFVSE